MRNYKETDLVRIAKRENNTKRNYLVVNQLQGKHMAVSPKEALDMFRKLADTIKGKYTGETLLLIGFAETATAIGAAVAVELGVNYIQTTREIIKDAEYLFFSEEHSHATEQKLVKNDIDLAIEKTDRIIFVEDEVTTGKTICNIIDILKQKYQKNIAFSVASLLNGMNEESLKQYQDRNIPLHYLVKTDHTMYGERAEAFQGNGQYVDCDTDCKHEVEEINADGWMDARRMVDAQAYVVACEKLWMQMKESFSFSNQEKVLVLGTEEFMYPALYVAGKIEEMGAAVRYHATTRSPIAVSMEEAYPLHTRYELASLYDAERRTFIYDIVAYDQVLIVTDAHNKEREGVNSLVNAVRRNNQKISVVRWRENA